MALTQEISTLALVGSPNCGKTALFNALTGLHHKVANYPGVTVDWAEGFSRKQYTQVWKILDLPGTYSLQPQSEDEKLTRDILCAEGQRPARADLFLCVADATNLHLHLRLVLEVLALGQPTVLALNMMDQAEKEGLKPNIESLAAELGIPVVPISALRHLGLQELMQTVQETLEQRILPKAQINLPDAISRIRRVEQILQKSMSEPLGGRSRVTDQIDRWLLHPLFGSLALCLVFLLVFQAIFSWAALPQELLEKGMGLLGRSVGSLMPDGLWKSLLVDGLISGVGNVLVFLPQILILFFFLLLLEDSGYMARAAFILDRLMRRVGMNGRSVLPLVSGLACAIPSIMSTRIMGHRRERWLTILITPLMTCSARLPVYTLLIGAFIPKIQIFGFLNLPGFVLFILYFGGVASALAVAWVIQKFGWISGKSSFVMELPTYRLPSFANLMRELYNRGQAFITRAGTFILAVMVVLWFLSSFPIKPEIIPGTAIDYSFAGRMGHWLEPIFKPLGWNWHIVVALIPGFAAREVLVSALGMVYAIDSAVPEDQAMAQLATLLPHDLTLAAALGLLAWYVFAPQCFATFAVMQRETRSWRMTAGGFIYLLLLAYGAAWFVHMLASALLS